MQNPEEFRASILKLSDCFPTRREERWRNVYYGSDEATQSETKMKDLEKAMGSFYSHDGLQPFLYTGTIGSGLAAQACFPRGSDFPRISHIPLRIPKKSNETRSRHE